MIRLLLYWLWIAGLVALLEILKNNAPILADHPWEIAQILLPSIGLTCGGTYMYVKQRYEERIQVLKERLENEKANRLNTEERLKEINSRMLGEKIESKYKNFTNNELSEAALKISKRLEDAILDEGEQIAEITEEAWKRLGLAPSEQEKAEVRKLRDIEIGRISRKFMSTYREEFQSEIILIFQECKKRIDSRIIRETLMAQRIGELSMEDPTNRLSVVSVMRAIRLLASNL